MYELGTSVSGSAIFFTWEKKKKSIRKRIIYYQISTFLASLVPVWPCCGDHAADRHRSCSMLKERQKYLQDMGCEFQGLVAQRHFFSVFVNTPDPV